MHGLMVEIIKTKLEFNQERRKIMLLRIILLPLFMLDSFPVAMAHYKSIRKCIKHWVIDGCKDVTLN